MTDIRKIPIFEKELPITPICRLSQGYDNGANQLFVKRDDLLPFSFGGNKVRKAAEFYREIQEKAPDVIMTYGTATSNHCRVIANMAMAMGISCHLISPEDEGDTPHFNRYLTESFGATIESCPVTQVADTISQRQKAYMSEGRIPYFIQGGGHGNQGVAGYVKCYQEIIRQEKKENIQFDYIFHASGTGATQAGLVCGRFIHEEKGAGPAIIGISIARGNPRGREVVKESIRDYLGDGFENLCQEKELTFLDDYILGGYGKYDPQVSETVQQLLRRDGIYADTTYVGKAFRGMQQYIEEHHITGKKILFIHTGSAPLFFDGLKI